MLITLRRNPAIPVLAGTDLQTRAIVAALGIAIPITHRVRAFGAQWKTSRHVPMCQASFWRSFTLAPHLIDQLAKFGRQLARLAPNALV
jgi:hypothetical protein